MNFFFFFEITFNRFIKLVFLKIKWALYFGKSNLNVKAGEITIKYPYTTIKYVYCSSTQFCGLV